jgi:hypothetical protein
MLAKIRNEQVPFAGKKKGLAEPCTSVDESGGSHTLVPAWQVHCLSILKDFHASHKLFLYKSADFRRKAPKFDQIDRFHS